MIKVILCPYRLGEGEDSSVCVCSPQDPYMKNCLECVHESMMTLLESFYEIVKKEK